MPNRRTQAHTDDLTINEVAYVMGQPKKAIDHLVERGIIKAKLERRGKGRLRKVGPAELRFLAVY